MHQHTPTTHKADVCAYRSITIHACTHSLSLSHTFTDPLSPILPFLVPYQPPVMPPGAPPAALPPSLAVLPRLHAKCRGSLPYCTRADSTQRQHTTHAASQPGSQEATSSYLLLLCESLIQSSGAESSCGHIGVQHTMHTGMQGTGGVCSWHLPLHLCDSNPTCLWLMIERERERERERQSKACTWVPVLVTCSWIATTFSLSHAIPRVLSLALS